MPFQMRILKNIPNGKNNTVAQLQVWEILLKWQKSVPRSGRHSIPKHNYI